MSEERKKFTVYLHPDQAADSMSLDIIESVPRNDRGELYRKALISGLALHQLDPRLPGLLALLLIRTSLRIVWLVYSARLRDGNHPRPTFVMCLQNWEQGTLLLQSSLTSWWMMSSSDWKRPEKK